MQKETGHEGEYPLCDDGNSHPGAPTGPGETAAAAWGRPRRVNLLAVSRLGCGRLADPLLRRESRRDDVRVGTGGDMAAGDPTPSPDDHELTRRLVAAGVVMGIDLVDHIVLGDSRYCSFKEMGKL